MNLTDRIIIDWARYCINTCGRLLPINVMHMDGDDTVLMGHAVALHEPPIQTIDGVFAREVLIYYAADDVLYTNKH